MSQPSSTIRVRMSIAYLTHTQEASSPIASAARSVFSHQRNTSSMTSFPVSFAFARPAFGGRDGGEVTVEGRGEVQMRDEEVRQEVERRGEEESIEDEEVEKYYTTPLSLTFSPANTMGRPLLGDTQHLALLSPPTSATSSRSHPHAVAQEPSRAASGSVITFVDPWARDRQRLAEEARERAERAQWRRTIGGFEASTNANVDVEAGVDAQVEGRPEKRSRTPEKSASEPKTEGGQICDFFHQPLAPGSAPHIHLPSIRSQLGWNPICAICHHPLASGSPPHAHLPPIRSQLDAWSAAALDGAPFTQPESPPYTVFAPGSVGDYLQRLDSTRRLPPPRPSHLPASEPLLAQVAETLHPHRRRFPPPYPTPPLIPTPSQWFTNRNVADLPRPSHHRPSYSDPFFVPVASTLHPNRQRSPQMHLEIPSSEWFRNFNVAEQPERGVHPFREDARGVYPPAVDPPAVNPPALHPPTHPDQERLPQYEELYFEAAAEDDSYWLRRADALRTPSLGTGTRQRVESVGWDKGVLRVAAAVAEGVAVVDVDVGEEEEDVEWEGGADANTETDTDGDVEEYGEKWNG